MLDKSQLQKHLELISASLQKGKFLGHTSRKKKLFLLFKGNIAHLACGLALMTPIFTRFNRKKSSFVHAKYTRTQCVGTIHVPNKFVRAFLIPTIRGDCATRRYCSE